MNYSFTEFSTNAVLKVGNSSLLEHFQTSKPTSYYTFIWAQDQPAHIIVDHLPVTLEPHQILSLTPNQYLEVTPDQEFLVFQFNREFYCIKDHDQEVSCVGLLFFGNIHNPIVQLDAQEQEKFKQLYGVFLDEMTTKDTIQAEMLRMLMARFIIKTTRLLKTQTSSLTVASGSQNDLLRQFNFLVEQHFKKEHKVSFYAEQLYKSPKTLSNSFAKYQLSPLQIIHNRLVLETQRLLMYTDKTTKEIAYELGFEDASHLSRIFKKTTGSSPSQFKTSHKTALV